MHLEKTEDNYSILEKQKLDVRITKGVVWVSFFCHLQGEGYEYVEILDPDCFQGGFVHHHHKEQKSAASHKLLQMGF